MSKRNTIRSNVEYLLNKYPKTRDSDRHLYSAYWIEIDGLLTIARDFCEKHTSAESIRRARQLIQAEGLYPPSAEAKNARRAKRTAMKNEIKKGEVI